MRLAVIGLVVVLAGCAGTKDRLNYFSASSEKKDVIDRATCESYGAIPGSDIFVACMLQLRKDRPMITFGGVQTVGSGPTHCDSLALGGGLTSTNCQ